MELKDSGFSWIRKIPVNWEVRRVKQVFYQKKEKAFTDNPTILSLARDGVKIRDISTNEGQLAADYSTYNPVSKNDLLLNPMDLYSGDNCNISRVTGVISPAYVNLRNICQFDTPEFFNYYFKYQYWSMAFFAHGRGVSFDNRWTLTNEVLRNYPVLYPPVQEQKVIADYLDKECARIDGIVATQRQIIERLKEYKKSVITEAITRGLNPNAPMKDSGIEWIGKIPEHWKAGKIFYYLEDIGSGTTPSGEDYYTEDGINWLNTGDLTDGYITNIPKKITPKAMEDFSTLKLHDKNSIVIAMYGATIGKLGILTEKTTTNQACCVMTPNKDLSYKFLFYCLYAGKDYMMYLSFGSGQPNINQNILRHFIIPHIPIEEQQAIANYLDRKCSEIDSIIEKRERMIELMTEYKKSLIYECVTGKKEIVDVVE